MTFFKQKRIYILFAFLSVLLCSFNTADKNIERPKILVFSKTAGYKHASIPTGIAAIQKLGAENGYDVDTTTNAAKFTDENLKQYSAVVFMSTTGNVLNGERQDAF